MHRFMGILGMLTMMGLAYAFSTNRRAIRYKTVAWGLGLQIAFAFLVMRWEYGRLLFEKLGAGANWLLDFAFYGSAFVFGDLGQKNSPEDFISPFRRCRPSFSSPLFLRCSTTSESCKWS